jgi:FtsH-binding integral membrane protein
MLATVFVGFAPTYYLAEIFQAPLPNRLIHIHGAAFSCWMLLLIVQTSLVSAGRGDIHRRLGIAGLILACLMVVLGVMAATDTLIRQGPPGRDPRSFYAIPLANMVVFGTLIVFAFRARFNPTAHKRLILLATNALLIAAIARWPLTLVHRNSIMAGRVSYIFLLMLVLYDWWSVRKLHRATMWAGAFLVTVQQLAIPIGRSAPWHAFAGWVKSAAG